MGAGGPDFKSVDPGGQWAGEENLPEMGGRLGLGQIPPRRGLERCFAGTRLHVERVLFADLGHFNPWAPVQAHLHESPFRTVEDVRKKDTALGGRRVGKRQGHLVGGGPAGCMKGYAVTIARNMKDRPPIRGHPCVGLEVDSEGAS